MNISEAARKSGLSCKTIRYYESIQLILPASRGKNGYRYYTESDVNELSFLQRARAAGFSVNECRELLNLYRNTGRHSAHVKSLVLEKIKQVDTQIAELTKMRETLLSMSDRCVGNESPNCAILQQLSDGISE